MHLNFISDVTALVYYTACCKRPLPYWGNATVVNYRGNRQRKIK